jgi:HlyD family secretion protein
MTKEICIIMGAIVLSGCGPGDDTPDAWGNFEATEVMVSAETGGRLLSFDVEEGARLDSGQVAGWVDTIPLNLKVRQLEAQKEAVLSRLVNIRAQADVHREQKAVAEVELERVRRMFDDGAATQRQLDDVSGRIRILDRQIDAAGAEAGSIRSEARVIDAQVAELRDRTERSAIRAPVSGTVLVKYAEAGEMAAPGKPLFKLADLETMYLRAYISGAQLGGVRLGQPVEVLFDGSDGTLDRLTGEVSWIASRGEFTPRTIQTRDERVTTVYAIKVRVRNDGRLKIGMPGEVRF